MTKRVSFEQRQMLFNYMQGHEDLARGRISGPDAARQKKNLLEELTTILNSASTGATKTPEKWLKCWQDWKSDVKAKWLKIKKSRAGTGGGPSPAPLSLLEERLLSFFGEEMVDGVPGVNDPLQVPENTTTEQEVTGENEIVIESDNIIVEEIKEDTHRRKPNDDPLHIILQRQAAAIEDVAQGMHAIASALHEIAVAIKPEQ